MYLDKNTNETFYSSKEIVVNGVRYPKQVFDNVETLNSLDVFELIEEPIPNGRLYTYVEEVDAINLVLKRTPIPRTEVELLQVAKEYKLAQIESDYILAESQSVSYLGFNFIGGAESVTAIEGYVRLNRMASAVTHNIWDVNGIEHSLTDAESDGLLLTIGSQASINKFTKKNRKVALAVATTIAEVEAI
ncbi:MAG: hypothetical protein WCX83_00200 [Candidatus Cloacimonas sp.]